MQSEIVMRARDYVDSCVRDLHPGRMNGMKVAVIEAAVPAWVTLGAVIEHVAHAVANVAGTVFFLVGAVFTYPCCETSSLYKAWAHLNDALLQGAEACVRIPMSLPRGVILVAARLWDPDFREPDNVYRAVLTINKQRVISLKCNGEHEEFATKVMETWTNPQKAQSGYPVTPNKTPVKSPAK